MTGPPVGAALGGISTDSHFLEHTCPENAIGEV